ncbi:ABC transporter substrate-binding protein, partial [Staphylococcus aureus]|uniref:ABC transporter substrate-binding protein n=1 Tax=Staphylococcus aureus TaxID=1280 RepID=UPI0037DA5A88
KKLHSWLNISTLIHNVKVKHKYTLEFNFKQPYQPPFPQLPIPPPYLFLSPKHFKNPTTKHPLKNFHATPPFKLPQHKKHHSPHFNKNHQYSTQKSKLNKLQPKLIPAPQTPFLSIKKPQTNFAFTHHTGTDTLDKHS